jgi:hypothetical protein
MGDFERSLEQRWRVVRMTDPQAEIEKLLKAGVPQEVAVAIVRRMRGLAGSERDMWQSLGMK